MRSDDHNARRAPQSDSGEFLVTLSPSGQVTVPAPIRKAAKAKGVTRFRVRVIDAEAGVFQFEPVLSLAALFEKHARAYDPPLRETMDEMDAEEAEDWERHESRPRST